MPGYLSRVSAYTSTKKLIADASKILGISHARFVDCAVLELLRSGTVPNYAIFEQLIIEDHNCLAVYVDFMDLAAEKDELLAITTVAAAFEQLPNDNVNCVDAKHILIIDFADHTMSIKDRVMGVLIQFDDQLNSYFIEGITNISGA